MIHFRKIKAPSDDYQGALNYMTFYIILQYYKNMVK